MAEGIELRSLSDESETLLLSYSQVLFWTKFLKVAALAENTSPLSGNIRSSLEENQKGTVRKGRPQ